MLLNVLCFILGYKIIYCEITVFVNHYRPNLELIYKTASSYRRVLLCFGLQIQ